MRPVEVILSLAILFQVDAFLHPRDNQVLLAPQGIHENLQPTSLSSSGAIRLAVDRPAFVNTFAVIERDFNVALNVA